LDDTVPTSLQPPRVLRFGAFEVDLREGELRRSGLRIKLQEQPFQVLAILLERPGEMVSREELQQRLWPADTFVDFDHSLNSAIKKLREALGDQSNNPRFIETLHRRGYRFIAPVEGESRGPEMFSDGERPPTESAGDKGSAVSVQHGPRRAARIAGVSAAVAVVVALVVLWTSPLPPPRILNYTQITHSGTSKINVVSVGSIAPPMVTDGSRVFFTEEERGGNNAIGQVSVAGGDTILVPTSFPNAGVLGISPSGSDLLIYTWLANELRVPLWVMPVLGGSPRRIGEVTQDATWSADGQIVYGLDHDLYVAKSDGTESRKLVSVPGLPIWPRWSPRGDVLRFTEHDPKKDSSSLWEVLAAGTPLRPLLSGWNSGGEECCGNWTPDGQYFIFQSTRNGRTDLWAIREQQSWWRKARHEPVQLTAGPMSLSLPLPSKSGEKIFALGSQLRGELVRYDNKSGQFVTFMSGMSATGLAFSRDGDLVTYVAYPERTLWRSKADGSQRAQLTFPPMEALAPRWSPDAKQIAFMGRSPGEGWRVYLVPAAGGEPAQRGPAGDEPQAAPDWSPDGSTVVFGGFPEEISGDAKATSLHLLDLKTHQTSTVTDSQGLYCPRWSPDGKYISATTADGQRLLLLDLAASKWMEPVQLQEGCPAWSRDGKYLYFQSFDVKDPAFFRMRISDRKRERLMDIGLRRVVADWYWWNGLAPDDSPLLLRDESEEIYSLDWQLP
jgi:Tol biopolymer transport system component/DNA-binding winged helix-turn-helix (wHTH) protein